MSEVEKRLEELGVTLPEVPAPVAAYISAVRAGGFVFTAGQVPRQQGAVMFPGTVGSTVTPEDARQSARVAAIQALAAVKSVAGSLDNVSQVVKATVFVNSADGFTEQPSVADGASELFMAAFGEAGKHARSAVGVKGLPLNSCVEVELIVALREA